MRQRVGFIQAYTFVPHLQCEILVPYKNLGKMRREQTVNPWREARDDTNFMWSRMPAIRQRLISPRTLEAREENGPAKSFKCNSSRSRLVTAFCFLSCDTSSNFPLRSRQQIILNGRVQDFLKLSQWMAELLISISLLFWLWTEISWNKRFCPKLHLFPGCQHNCQPTQNPVPVSRS